LIALAPRPRAVADQNHIHAGLRRSGTMCPTPGKNENTQAPKDAATGDLVWREEEGKSLLLPRHYSLEANKSEPLRKITVAEVAAHNTKVRRLLHAHLVSF